jgi:VWFA-related protein
MEILGFDSDVYAASAGFTSDKSKLVSSLKNLNNAGMTAVYNGVYASLKNLEGLAGRRSTILLSDGGDNSSTVTKNEVINLANTLNIPIYTIGVKSSEFNTEHANLLQTLASDSGGRFYTLNDLSSLANLFTAIDQQINNEYIITYTSPLPLTINNRLVRVQVKTDNTGEWDTKQYQIKQ